MEGSVWGFGASEGGMWWREMVDALVEGFGEWIWWRDLVTGGGVGGGIWWRYLVEVFIYLVEGNWRRWLRGLFDGGKRWRYWCGGRDMV